MNKKEKELIEKVLKKKINEANPEEIKDALSWIEGFEAGQKQKDAEWLNKLLPEQLEVSLKSEREKILGEIKLAKQCLDFKLMRYDNLQCKNVYCPLNKIFDKKIKDKKKIKGK